MTRTLGFIASVALTLACGSDTAPAPQRVRSAIDTVPTPEVRPFALARKVGDETNGAAKRARSSTSPAIELHAGAPDGGDEVVRLPPSPRRTVAPVDEEPLLRTGGLPEEVWTPADEGAPSAAQEAQP